ncbi:MAG: hypothetical protein NUW01_12835 [Gemmatimonadaceae bacterium]|nr:hypothetical protein [Gemmatimonadaceae bacterium]
MNKQLGIWLVAVAIALAGAPVAAGAQCVTAVDITTADAADAELRRLDIADCLGGNRCSSASCVQFNAWRSAPSAQGAVELLTAIRNSAASAGESGNLNRLMERIDAWIAVVGLDAIARSEPAHWTYEEGGGGLFLDTPYAIEIDASVEQACARGARACAEGLAEAVEIVTDATLVRRINGVLLSPTRVAIVEYVTALDKRWENYFNRTPSQFPWELLLNSALYKQREQRGYNEPPSSQLILLHPSAAFAYATSGDERLRSALVLEALGYFTRGFGGSLAAVWSDRPNQRKVGYAILVHWQNRITMGAAYHGGGDPTVLLSANVEKFLTGNARKVRDALTKLR